MAYEKIATEQWVNENKQNKLTAGENVTIDENNVISATGGSGTTEREWQKLGEYDIATIGGSTDIIFTNLDNFTEFYIESNLVKNNTTYSSGYKLLINGKELAGGLVHIGNSSSANYSHSYLKFNGLYWEINKSNPTISKEYLAINSSYQNPYNVCLNVGKATTIGIFTPSVTYLATSGTIIVYGR